MNHTLHLKTILLLLLSLCLLLPLQPALADSTASVTIGTAASSNGTWSGASPDVWTPGDSGVSTVAVSEITDRLANSGVVITAGSSITVATAVNWASSNALTLNAGTNISINAAINATSGALTLAAGTTISAIDQISVNLFTLSSGSWSQIGSLPDFSVTDFRISGGSFIRVQGGDGTSNNPYQITDSYGLQGIGSSADMLTKSYQLANDISASGTANWNSGAGFKPIGDYTTRFTGSFDGQIHTIDRLTINRSSSWYVGLFSTTDSAAVIRNVGLTNASITGAAYVGGLAGVTYGSISNAYVTGSVSGSSVSNGGLVGLNFGSISNAYATGNVKGGGYAGGLVGENYGSISNAYATGDVSGSSTIGGLAGYNFDGSISASYATGNVWGSGNNVGGLVGKNYGGSVSNTYATGNVTGGVDNVGGLVGVSDSDGNGHFASISNAYAIGRVSCGRYFGGGLVGYNHVGSDIRNAYWDISATGQNLGIGMGSGTVTNVTGLATADMMTASSFSAWETEISATGGSSAIWRIYEGNTYPLLRSFLTPMSVTANNAAKNYDATPYSGGNGVQYAPAGYNPARVAGTLAYGGTAQGATAIGSYTITPDGLFSDQLGYDIAFISGVLNINGYWLTLGISGSGTVNSSNGTGLGYACNTATCSAVPFGSGDTVTLTATGSNSSFSSWSGDYVSISNPGSITMNANKAITATFSPGAATVKIDNDSTPYYSINSALAAPTQDTVIRATATGFTENVSMQNSHTLTLKGGYSDNSFSSQTGYSTINGSLTVSSGTLVVDRVVVGP